MAQKKKLPITDAELLEELKDILMKRYREKEFKPKVDDILKVIDVQKRLITGDADAGEKFWEIIEQLRREELKDD